MAQSTGRATIKLEGEAIRSKPGATLKHGGIEREYDITDQGLGYYREKFVPSRLTCTMPHLSDTDVVKLQKFRDGTITYETDTGIVFTVPNACFESMDNLANGEISVTFAGEPAK